MKPLAIDLFCCAGGASDGLVRAGFEVIGVDREPQPEYPHAFRHLDALDAELGGAAFVWASPPCQKHTAYRRRPNHVAPAECFIDRVRAKLIAWGGAWVIENVPGAPLENPAVLCGSMFGLDVRRHRLFECSFPVTPPPCRHDLQTPRFAQATNRANRRSTVEVGVWRIPLETQWRAMGLDRHVSLAKLSQMVPPAYAEWLGLQARAHILTSRRAA